MAENLKLAADAIRAQLSNSDDDGTALITADSVRRLRERIEAANANLRPYVDAVVAFEEQRGILVLVRKLDPASSVAANEDYRLDELTSALRKVLAKGRPSNSTLELYAALCAEEARLVELESGFAPGEHGHWRPVENDEAPAEAGAQRRPAEAGGDPIRRSNPLDG